MTTSSADFSGVANPGLAPVAGWGVIAAEGADARSFLHGQLSQEVSGLDAEHWRLAAWCSAKGRMLASLWLLAPAPDQVLLLCPQDLIAVTLQKLSMYVLRAKCRLRDASAEWQLHGHWGVTPDLPAGLAEATPGSRIVCRDAAERLWLEAGGTASLLQGAELPLADAPASGTTTVLQRSLSLTPAHQPAPQGPPVDALRWAVSDVALGWPHIQAPTREHFVPQMINWELLDGVNFRKGCYPGQEVVARSQYRGTTKRRALPFGLPVPAGQTAAADTPPSAADWAGREVLLITAQGAESVGEIIQATPAGAAMQALPWSWVGLMELQLSALDGLTLPGGSASLALGERPSADGSHPPELTAEGRPALTLLQPAYSLARAED